MPSNEPHPPPRAERFLGWTVLLLAVGWCLANLHRGRIAGWDEWEFLRATDWVRQGKVPFRDFWEHHAPLQWYLMAPIEALAPKAGNTPLLWLRWAQVPCWCAGLAALYGWMRSECPGGHERRLFAAALLSTPFFVFMALQYRVDTLSTLLALFAILAHSRGFLSRAWALGVGALWSLTWLANLRLAPMAVFGLLLAAFMDTEAHKWRPNPRLPALAAGALAPVMAWGIVLVWTHTLEAAFKRVILDNALASNSLAKGTGNLFPTLAPLVTSLDLPGIILMVAGLAGLALALLDLRRPGPMQCLALIQLVNLAFIWQMRVYYPYHFQSVILLMVPLAAHGVRWGLARTTGPVRWQPALLAILAVQVAWNGWCYFTSAPGEDWRYQDQIIREAESATTPAQKILDGYGCVLDRQPAYKYWFIPLLVRILSVKKAIEPYRLPAFSSEPPGAILYGIRMANWLREWPELGRHAVTHYLPVYPNLWLPGLSGVLAPSNAHCEWTVPVTAQYRILASQALAGHPWFRAPWALAIPSQTRSSTWTITTGEFQSSHLEDLSWSVNGREAMAGEARLDLHAGDHLELAGRPGMTLGVMVVPMNRARLFQPVPGDAQFDEYFSYYKEN